MTVNYHSKEEQKMAKRSAKRFNSYNKQLETTKSSAFMILKNLGGVDEQTFLRTVFFTTDDPIIKKIVNKAEYILSDAIVNPVRFASTLHSAYEKFAKEIIDNKWLSKFIETVHVMYEHNSNKKHLANENKVTTAYYNFMIQLATYLTPVGEVLIGVDKEDNALHVTEKYPDIDKIVFMVSKEFERKSYATYDDFCKEVAKRLRDNGFGNNIKTYADVQYLFTDEQLTTDALFIMAPFIKSMDSPLLDFPYLSPIIGDFVIPNRLPYLDEIMGGLQSRRRLLPKEGVIIERVEGTEGIGELWMAERLYRDTLYMIFKLKVNGNSLVGYYNTRSEFFFTILRDAEGFMRQHIMFQAFILDIYAHLTTDEDRGIVLVVHDKKATRETGKHSTHIFDKRFLKEAEVDVDFYIRKLPVGSVASPEAIANANRYGIKLLEGETFVKPFTRKTYNKVKEK